MQRHPLLARLLRAVVALSGLLLLSTPRAWSQPAPSSHVAVPDIAARPEDVSTVDGMIRAFYDVISGPAGRPREWARDRTLYIPGVRFTVASVQKGKPSLRVTSHQEYVDQTDAELVKLGFFEREIHRVSSSFGNLLHVWSTYESRRTPDGPVIVRGLNSIQLVHDGRRWWIASATWQDEGPEHRIPPQLLPK